jgi:hypothetical protein
MKYRLSSVLKSEKTNISLVILLSREAVYRTTMERFKNCKQLFEYKHLSYLETSGGQSYDLFLNVVHFLTPVLIRHLWQLKTVVFLHWCLICAVPF